MPGGGFAFVDYDIEARMLADLEREDRSEWWVEEARREREAERHLDLLEPPPDEGPGWSIPIELLPSMEGFPIHSSTSRTACAGRGSTG